MALAAAIGAASVAALPPPADAQTQGGARGDPAAEAFVQTEAQRALNILSSDRLDRAAEKRAFRQFIDQTADVPRITGFVLGKYARSVTPVQKQSFASVFRDYADGVYESRLSQYHGETLKVTGSVARTPTDVIVHSQIVGGRQAQPVLVDWRVLSEGGGWKVVDVDVGGVWLAITEQQDFVSTIDNAGGDVDVLIAQLRRNLAQGAIAAR